MAPQSDRMPLTSSEDVVVVRQRVRTLAVQLGLGLVDQTKIVTAVSELARNTVVYGGGGWADVQMVTRDGRKGVQVVCEDHGPGIPDIDKALEDGFTTGSGLGLGLGGAKRLVNEFHLTSVPGQGTRVSIIRWKP